MPLALSLDLSRFQHVSLKEKIVFTKNLQIMLKTGLPLAQALGTLAKQTENERFRRVIAEIQVKIEQGNPLGQTLKKYPQIFNNLFVSMVESGEVSGNLEEVLNYLQLQMKKDHEVVSKVRGAMIYPTIVVIAMVGIGTAMMVFVIPKLIDIFREVKATLPLPTRMLIALSSFITEHGIWLLAGLIVAVIGLKIFTGQMWAWGCFTAYT